MSSLRLRSWIALVAFAGSIVSPLTGCTMATGDNGEDDEETEPTQVGSEAEAISVGVDCAGKRSATGYKSGSSFSITIVDADGKPIEIATASMYAKMQRAAAKDGVAIRVVSGFRTYAHQQQLYNAYLNGTGNLAAKPGYSNHQSGHALDLNTSASGVSSWLAKHGAEYGFKRTVPSEVWHWEYWGPMVDGGCGSTVTPPPTTGCSSDTLGRAVPTNTCVQSKNDKKWYQCVGGNEWKIRWDVPAACVSEHPL